jgi:hypothetical protein
MSSSELFILRVDRYFEYFLPKCLPPEEQFLITATSVGLKMHVALSDEWIMKLASKK